MNEKKLSLELCSLRHTIDDLLISQEVLASERLHLQIENERLRRHARNHRHVVRDLRRQLERQQATQVHLEAALAAALQLQEAVDE